MGEYALFNGESIKIGTCEDMYYLRFDQRHKVTPVEGNVDPVKDAEELRFRFPFPDEDDKEPGDFFDFDRSVAVACTLPCMAEKVNHRSIQFFHPSGLNVLLPCPAGRESIPGVRVHTNGCTKTVLISQQRLVDDRLVLICKCAMCDAAFRLPTLDEAQPVIDALRAIAERAKEKPVTGFHYAMSHRIMAGYMATSRRFDAAESK
jgi:hypothetical protein